MLPSSVLQTPPIVYDCWNYFPGSVSITWGRLENHDEEPCTTVLLGLKLILAPSKPDHRIEVCE